MPARLAAAVLLAALCASARADPSEPALDAAAAAIRAGERGKALALLAAARKRALSPEQREAAALLYADLKDYGTAKSLMAARIRESPDDARLRLYLATIVARDGDRGAALAALAEARRRNPNAADRQRMAFLYQDFKEYAPARELLDGLIAESPRDLSVRLDRASLAAASGDAEGGLAQLAAARELEPGPDERRRMAGLHRDLRDFGRARVLLRGLVSEFPGDAGLRFDLAALEARSGGRAAALKALGEARERAAGLDLRRRVAGLYEDLGEREEARAALRDLVRDEPGSPAARLDLAELDARRGERAAALEQLAAAAALAPDHQERQRMARAYSNAGDFKTARRIIDRLVAEQPGDPQLRLTRAEIAADAGDAAAARASLAEARARAPDPDDRRRMTTLYERLGEPGEARAVVEKPAKKSR